MDTEQLLGFDTETTGLDWEDRARLVQFGTDVEAFCFDPKRFPDLTRLLALRPNTCAHNAPFDARHLANLTGFTTDEVLRGVIDTRVLSYLVDPRGVKQGASGHGLKGLAAQYVDGNAGDGDAELKQRFKDLGFKTESEGWANISLEDPTYLMYAGLDPILTVRLHNELLSIIERRQQTHLIEFDHKVLKVCTKMRDRGVRIDTDYARQLKHQKIEEERHHLHTCQAMGLENPNSGQQVVAALQARGCELTKRTPKGGLSTKEEHLAALDDGLAREIVAVKKAHKFATWLNPFIDSEQIDSRIRCDIKTGSVTYRLSASKPNMMNLPSDSWEIRRCVIPDPGHSILLSDYAQIEMRVVALISQDRKMIDILKEGADLHNATATTLYGSGFTPEHRNLAKQAGFALLYGSGPDNIAEKAGVSRAEARNAIDGFYRAYSGVRQWSQRLIDQMKYGRSVVSTISGRRIPVDHWKPYVAVNYSIQSAAADIFRDALIKLDDAGIQLLLPVHDEIMAQARAEEVQETAIEIERIMSDEIDGIPFPAETKVAGPSWGHAYGAPEVAYV
jgi:DNA polymerase-1